MFQCRILQTDTGSILENGPICQGTWQRVNIHPSLGLRVENLQSSTDSNFGAEGFDSGFRSLGFRACDCGFRV